MQRGIAAVKCVLQLRDILDFGPITG